MVQIHSPRPFIPVSLFQRFMKELLFSFPRYKWVHWVQKGVDRTRIHNVPLRKL
jgi:hypothetical protein